MPRPPAVSDALAVARRSLSSNATPTAGSNVSAGSESRVIPEPTSQPLDKRSVTPSPGPMSPDLSEVEILQNDLEQEWAHVAELERALAALPTLGAFRRLRAQVRALGGEPCV